MNLQPTLSKLTTAPPLVAGNLAAFPLFGPASGKTPDYALLDDALSDGTVEITEVSESGSVPDLKLKNIGQKPVLLLDGDQLVGAKQNRVINLSILVAAMADTVIPVTCVERGRWAYRSRRFERSNRKMAARMRRSKMAQVSESIRMRGQRYANQAQVWDEVEALAMRTGTHSATGAMEDVYMHTRERLSRHTETIRLPKDARGAVLCVDGRVAGLELYDRADTLQKVGQRLVESYAIDAACSDFPIEETPPETEITDFLARISAAPVERFPAMGLGEDLRLETDGVIGGALVVDEAVMHLSAFERAI